MAHPYAKAIIREAVRQANGGTQRVTTTRSSGATRGIDAYGDRSLDGQTADACVGYNFMVWDVDRYDDDCLWGEL